jgi:hypothetical protein
MRIKMKLYDYGNESHVDFVLSVNVSVFDDGEVCIYDSIRQRYNTTITKNYWTFLRHINHLNVKYVESHRQISKKFKI